MSCPPCDHSCREGRDCPADPRLVAPEDFSLWHVIAAVVVLLVLIASAAVLLVHWIASLIF